ncbi:hypothetical protein BKA66DRAFT_553835 [Pyrenochaeta sp. MPI-SDFR-AT-0127]|nr:hypothetical protein BKA66DRAFT_553835 [Pyrenochaeta sp. MPI-SDFR-AT-0127]
MSFPQRLLSLALVPIIALLVLQILSPNVFQNAHTFLQPYISSTSPRHHKDLIPSRFETPLIVSAFPHWSHYEKIAKIAVILADLGYPITFITGRIFEKEASNLHPNITYYPLLGKADKITEEEFQTFISLPSGSEEAELYLQKVALVDNMPATHETLQQVFQKFRGRYGVKKPLLSFFDIVVMGHLPILLGAPGIKPDVSFAVSCHPLSIDSNDTYPFHVDKLPETGPDAKRIHWRAYQDRHQHYRTRELDLYLWKKLQNLGAVQDTYPSMLHAMGTLPDHLMTLGIPEFEYPRSDLRKNIHYFGALQAAQIDSAQEDILPLWWDDLAIAKQEGKKIVAVSQGTVATNLNDLLIPTLKALEDRKDVLVIASTVVVEPSEVPGLILPANARAAKFVPYNLLLPYIDVLVNNGGYGAVMTALDLGIPLVVAGTGQDKILTNNLVQWTGVGINLRNLTPSVEAIRDGVCKVLDDGTYKSKAVQMSKDFEKYNLGEVFDRVIQQALKDWAIGNDKVHE